MSSFDPLTAAARAIRLARRGIAPDFDDSPLGDMERESLVEGLPEWLSGRRGWLYLASNASWGGVHKIGCTRKGVERRLAELGGAGLPTPWKLVRSWPAYDAHGLEARAHTACHEWLWPEQTELFIAPAEVLAVKVELAVQADRACLLNALQSVFLPGQLELLLDQEHTTTSPDLSYTS